MKEYTKKDVEHVLEVFKSGRKTLVDYMKDVKSVKIDGEIVDPHGQLLETEVGIERLEGLLSKDNEEWTFDDYMSFYKVKEYLA